LPERDLSREFGETQREFRDVFALKEQLFVVRLPSDSALAGKTLAETRLGPALDLNVIGIVRDERSRLVPSPDTPLYANDRLLVAGQPEQLAKLQNQHPLVISEQSPTDQNLVSEYIGLAELKMRPGSSLVGKTLEEVDFRQHYGANVLGICRQGTPIRTHLQQIKLNADDTMLIQAPQDKLDELNKMPDLSIAPAGSSKGYRLQEQLFSITIQEGSYLVGRTLAQTHLGDAFDLNVLCIVHPEGPQLMPEPDQHIQTGDTMIVEGRLEDLDRLGDLQNLQIEDDTFLDITDLETEEFGIVEAVLSPHTTLVGKHLRQIHFREKFGLNVLAIWREGQAYYSNLRDMGLKFGDALLLHGQRDKLRLLSTESDFILLTEEIQEPSRRSKAPIAVLIMAAVIGVVLLGWLPIAIAGVIGGTLMILTGCESMEEAYHDIDWRAVFLIAGMVPLGIAMQTSGTADYLAKLVVDLVGNYGAMAVITGLFLMTTLASQFMPNAIVTVLMAPIAINTANTLLTSPYAMMMAVAVAASAAFLSPVGHPANILVMGPGGYRFSDYLKVGIPLTITLMLVALLTIPIFWPLTR
jgi:di/tricarboxylate transporter